ncbi:MAG TPA: hypothetical protein VK013_04640 [Myxococcaceae bacterium]|nr:hypothetical protein [Myxococcaceae bacterium]
MAISPKKLLELLQSGADVPDVDSAQVATARALIAAPAEAPIDQLVSLAAPLAEAVLQAAVAAGTPLLATRLVDAPEAPKALVKAAKRSLHQLRSAGVDVPETAPAGAPIALVQQADSRLASLLLPIDGTGEYGLIVCRPLDGKVQVHQVIASDTQGVVSLERMTRSRDQYRKLLRVLLREQQQPVVEVSDDDIRRELGHAIQRNHDSGTAFPPGLHVLIGHYGVEPLPLPPVPTPEPEDAVLSKMSAQLFNEPLIKGWYPPESELRDMIERLDEIESSKLSLTDAQKRDQIIATVRGQAARFFTPEMRQVFAQRLWFLVPFLDAHGEAPSSAGIAKAEARTLAAGDLHTPTVFGQELFERALRLSKEDLLQAMGHSG